MSCRSMNVYQTKVRPGEITGVFTASFECVDVFCRQVRDLLPDGFSKSARFEITLLLREALNNAIVHGSNRSLEQSVCCTVTVQKPWVTITVQDQGEGFEWNERLHRQGSTADCQHPMTGIDIMKSMADEVQYNTKGNTISLRKKILSLEEGQ